MIKNTQPFYWRNSLFPDENSCGTLNRLPQHPTQISMEDIAFETNPITSVTVISWGPPVYTNGNLMSYDVCVSEVELEGEEECSSPVNVPGELPTFELPIQDSQVAVQVQTH